MSGLYIAAYAEPEVPLILDAIDRKRAKSRDYKRDLRRYLSVAGGRNRFPPPPRQSLTDRRNDFNASNTLNLR